MVIAHQSPATKQSALHNQQFLLSLTSILLSSLGIGQLLTASTTPDISFAAILSMLALLIWVVLLAMNRGDTSTIPLVVGWLFVASTAAGLLIADTTSVVCANYIIVCIATLVLLSPRQLVNTYALSITLGAGLLLAHRLGYIAPLDLGNQLYLGTTIGILCAFALFGLHGLRKQQLRLQAQATATYARERAQLEQAISDQQQRFAVTERTLMQRYAALHQKLVTIGELQIGVVPLAPGAFVVPLHGDVSLADAHAIRARLLAAYSLQEAHMLVLDVQCATCRPSVANVLVKTLDCIADLGVCVLVCDGAALLGPLPTRVERLPHLRAALDRCTV